LSVFLVAASVARFPILDSISTFKIGIFSAEVLSIVTLTFVLNFRSGIVAMTIIAAFLIFIKILLGSLIATVAFEQTLESSALEARFGLMFAALPIVFCFLRDLPSVYLKTLISTYLIGLAALNITVFTRLPPEALLVLGQRTDVRYMSSIIIPFACTLVLIVREIRSKEYRTFALIVSAAIFLHAHFVTTSRIEAIMAIGLFCFSAVNQWNRLRWLLYAAFFATVSIFISQLLRVAMQHDQGLAGRDFSFAVQLALDGLPWGYGLLTDANAKILLRLPEQFFFSDHGLISYVIRYGVLGICLSFGLILVWIRFLLKSTSSYGGIFVSVATLPYLVLVPFVDYGSLNGAFMTAAVLISTSGALKE
jgi:hypothetical protein